MTKSTPPQTNSRPKKPKHKRTNKQTNLRVPQEAKSKTKKEKKKDNPTISSVAGHEEGSKVAPQTQGPKLVVLDEKQLRKEKDYIDNTPLATAEREESQKLYNARMKYFLERKAAGHKPEAHPEPNYPKITQAKIDRETQIIRDAYLTVKERRDQEAILNQRIAYLAKQEPTQAHVQTQKQAQTTASTKATSEQQTQKLVPLTAAQLRKEHEYINKAPLTDKEKEASTILYNARVQYYYSQLYAGRPPMTVAEPNYPKITKEKIEHEANLIENTRLSDPVRKSHEAMLNRRIAYLDNPDDPKSHQAQQVQNTVTHKAQMQLQAQKYGLVPLDADRLRKESEYINSAPLTYHEKEASKQLYNARLQYYYNELSNGRTPMTQPEANYPKITQEKINHESYLISKANLPKEQKKYHLGILQQRKDFLAKENEQKKALAQTSQRSTHAPNGVAEKMRANTPTTDSVTRVQSPPSTPTVATKQTTLTRAP